MVGGEASESTTLLISSPKHRTPIPRELYASESGQDVSNRGLDSDADSSEDRRNLVFEKSSDRLRWCFSPGDTVELQVSLSQQTLHDVGCTSLGSAHGVEGDLSNKEAETVSTRTTAAHCVEGSVREPLSQHGVVLSSPSMLGQVEVTLQQPAASRAGRGLLSVGGPRVSEAGGSQSEGEGEDGHREGVTVSVEIPSQEAASVDEQDSDSEGDQDKPSKHRPRHARLRRNESQSEKQLKEAKSKCKRIALLLTAAPPNPDNKGLLMFKKHRQRAKKYTLVSYGTGEDEPEYSDEEEEINGDNKQGIPIVEFSLVTPNNSEVDTHVPSNAQSSNGVLTFNLDRGLLEIEKNLSNQAEMETLPETRGKGALMFAQRRQRMDEISAEHEELRRQGIPVEGVHEAEKKMVEQSYMQSTTEGHAYMDVNMHQQSLQQYHQYQEQQYYEQQQNYQQQQQYPQQYQQQHEQSHYQQPQMYQQQQEYHQAQQQMQHYTANLNGSIQHQTNEMQSSLTNRTAKPFTVENMAATPFSHAMSGTSQDSMGQGEQIASRDERISTPAIRSGLLMDTKRRSTGKPMFTFKEAPKVSPNPALLNLVNRGDKKLGFESGPDEDYLSLGAEACNFLPSQRVKNKIPPPVAPKPIINPSSPPWSPQIEATNQDMPHCSENSIPTPAVAPTVETTPAPELEPTPAPALESPPPPPPPPTPPPPPSQDNPASTTKEEQHAWTIQELDSQQPLQAPATEATGHMSSALQPETSPMTSWGGAQTQVQQQSSSWLPAQEQAQEPLPSHCSSEPPWVTRQPSQNQAQIQHPWNPQIQQPWAQSQEAQKHVQPPWVQHQEQAPSQPQVQTPWAHSNEQPHIQQMHPTWAQAQETMQTQPQNPWTQPPQTDSQQQPPWLQQSPNKSHAQTSWVQPESQPQPPWVQQPQYQTPQQTWSEAPAPGQPQPSWASAQTQSQQQPPANAWTTPQSQSQPQPPWIERAPAQPQAQPQASVNQWMPVLAQNQSQPPWAQHPPEHGQQHTTSWAQEQNQTQQQPPWAQPVPTQSPPQPSWQQSMPKTPLQPPMNTWSPANAQPQAPTSTWAPQSQQAPLNISIATVSTRPSPKPWQPPQNAAQHRSPPPPPQRMHSFIIGQRASSPINPMATVLNPSSSQGSAFEMPAVRGKGADMFAKRQSRMEKFIVDSETVEANKASRSASPAASLPNEWKYTPNVRAPPPRAYNPIQSPLYPPAASKQPPSSSPSTKAKKKEKQMPANKPLNVIDVMKHQPYQLKSSLFIFGPGVEAVKPSAPKPISPPPNPLCDSQPVLYEQMAQVHQTGPFSAPYPQQPYGMPMQPMMHDGHYQQAQANIYPPPNPYQQSHGGQYQQTYNQQYQQPVPPVYHPQSPQSPNSPYPHAMQPSYQPANSPPYLAAPSVPYQPQPPSSYITPSIHLAARPDSASGGIPVAAPKPKFTANKSSAQVWKPTAVDKE
ncbi:uncharacterized protein synpo2a [Pholidichthys leucotaenia]